MFARPAKLRNGCCRYADLRSHQCDDQTRSGIRDCTPGEGVRSPIRGACKQRGYRCTGSHKCPCRCGRHRNAATQLHFGLPRTADRPIGCVSARTDRHLRENGHGISTAIQRHARRASGLARQDWQRRGGAPCAARSHSVGDASARAPDHHGRAIVAQADARIVLTISGCRHRNRCAPYAGQAAADGNDCARQDTGGAFDGYRFPPEFTASFASP